jgi:cytidylate kinase
MIQKSLSDSLSAALVRAQDYKQGLEHAEAHEQPAFAITISREPGSQGPLVARAVGQRLGWPVYDQELLDRVAQEMGSHANLLKLIDEKPIGWLEQAVVNLVGEYNLNQDTYMIHLIATVRGLGQQGRCVIVGRGTNFLLPAETTLRVRLVGDLKDRIAVARRIQNLSDKEAARWVERTSHERLDFVKRYFNKDAADPHHYDLILNTSHLSIEECADVIATAVHRLQARKPGEGKKGTTA